MLQVKLQFNIKETNMAIKNNTPGAILNGIKDESIVALVPEPEELPIHLAHLYLRTAWGPEESLLLGSGDFTRIYGADSVDPRLPYRNHATVMLETLQGAGNSVFVKRVIPADAKRASSTVVLTIDSTPGIIKEYDRDADGSVKKDKLGNKLFKSGAVAVADGMSFRYDIVATSSLSNFGPAGSGNTIAYPLFTFTAAHVGERGNRMGVRMWMNGPYTKTPADEDIVADQDALLYSAQLVERVSASTTNVIDSLFGESTHTFALKPDAYDHKTNVDLNIYDLIELYSDDGKSTQASPVYGPLQSVRTHQSNIDLVLNRVVKVENKLSGSTTKPYMLDILQGVGFDNIDHYSFQVDSKGTKLTEGRTFYLQGGSDGTITDAQYNADVGNEIDSNFDNPKYPLLDTAQYPFSAFYDTGYPTVIKKKFLQWLSRRKDVHLTLVTHVDGEDQLTALEEVSVGTDLRISGQLYAESDLHGTGICRLVIMGQSGKFISNTFRSPVSTVFELARMRANYLGAGNGVVKSGLAYDNFPLNNIGSLKEVTNTYMNRTTKEAVWASGVNYCQFADRSTLFFPALQTVYAIKNSILVSEMLMQIAVDVTKQSEIVWRMLSGNTDLTQAQFIKKSNDLLSSLVEGKYDGKVTVEPNTYFTAADTARGYSWTQDVAVYGNGMKTVGVVNVVTRRA